MIRSMKTIFATGFAASMALIMMAAPSFAVTEDDVRAAYKDEYGNAVIIGKSGYKMIRVGAGDELAITIPDRGVRSYKDREECSFVGATVRGRSYMYATGGITPVIGKWVCD